MYFLYPETSGIRLEDMGVLFGDAPTIEGVQTGIDTPDDGEETGPLLDSASQGLSRNSGDVKRQPEGKGSSRLWVWPLRMNIFRSRENKDTGGGGRYAPLGQGGD